MVEGEHRLLKVDLCPPQFWISGDGTEWGGSRRERVEEAVAYCMLRWEKEAVGVAFEGVPNTPKTSREASTCVLVTSAPPWQNT